MQGIIYRAYNKITKKSYIGQTTQGLHKRMLGHYCKARKNKTNNNFQNALNKYNYNDWEWTELTAVDKESLSEREVYYIGYYDSYNNGYNSTVGGLEFNKDRVYIRKPKIKKEPEVKVSKNRKYTYYHRDLGYLTHTTREFIDIYNFSLCHQNSLKKKKNQTIQSGDWSLHYIPRLEKIEEIKKIGKFSIIHRLVYQGNIVEGTSKDIRSKFNLPSKKWYNIKNGRCQHDWRYLGDNTLK